MRDQYGDSIRSGRFGIRTPVGARDFLSSKTSRLSLELTYFPIQLIPGHFPEGKAVGESS